MATKIVDVDGHVLEPVDLWEKNLDPRFRDRALRIGRDECGAEYLEIAGRKSRIVQGGSLGSFGTLDEAVKARWEQDQSPTGPKYEEHVPKAARDMQARLEWMDAEGIDISLMYPSLCLGWQNECDDPELAEAYCQVYNDWLTDLCAPYSDRIVPIAMVPLLRVGDGVRELRRAAELGARGLYLNPIPMNGVPYGDRIYDSLWAECQERGMPVGLHISNSPLHTGRELYETNFGKNSWFLMMMYGIDCQIALTSLFHGGVFERFPRLSVGVLEAGCGWVAHWLERMDHCYTLNGHDLMKRPPSEYFDRQCWISGDSDEKAFVAMAHLVGAHKFMWASDYPHEEGHRHPLQALTQTLGALDEIDRNKILGANAVAAYRLN
jgi:predicted TIM-barrel fold metal-dependent hydrolase